MAAGDSSTTYMSFHGTGVFSSVGDTSQRTSGQPVHKLYWLVETAENGEMTIRHLDEKSWMPTGDPRSITLRELQRDMYRIEADLYRETVYPRLQDKLHLPVPDGYIPAKDSPESLEQDPIAQSSRDKFQEALSLLESGKLESAGQALTKILRDPALSQKRHRHLFNEFGINLRKNNLNDLCIDFYSRALELTGEGVDENLHFNLARALFDQNRYQACVQHLFKALKISPRNWAVLRFLAWMQNKNLIPKQYHLEVRGILAQGIPDIPHHVLQSGAPSPKASDSAQDQDVRQNNPNDFFLPTHMSGLEDLMRKD